MPEPPKIIKHGIRPEEKPVYFICYQCGCEFSMARKWCEVEEEITCRGETNQIEYIGEVEMLMVEVIGNIHDNIELFPEYAGGDDHAVD